jgi:hypothetical protein
MTSKIKKAINVLRVCLEGYCESNIREDIKFQKEVDHSWNLIVKELQKN